MYKIDDFRTDLDSLERRVYAIERCQTWHSEDIAAIMGHIAAIAARLPAKDEDEQLSAEWTMPLD